MGLRRAWAHVLLFATCVTGATGTALAQGPHRRNETRPQIPDFRPPPFSEGQILPPVEPENADALRSQAGGTIIHVTEYCFTGNSLLPDAELAEIARPFTNRPVTLAELKALRDLLTVAYVDRGFVTSGVVLLDQTVEGGVVTFHAIEGVVTDVEVTTDGRFRTGYLSSRLSRPLRGKPANISEIEAELQMLMEDELIDSVTAALVPDTERGEAILNARIQESRAFYARFTAISDLAPAIGGVAGRVALGHLNLFGVGDHARVGIGYGEGVRELLLGYTVPINAAGTHVAVNFLRNDSEIVDPDLATLDIQSESQNAGIALTHRLADSLAHQFDATFSFDSRRSESSLLGRGFSFTEGPEGGIAELTVARARQDWTYRSVSNVMALASTLSVGLDALGATTNEGDVPDGQFVAWLVQSQWAHRLGVLDSRLVARADLQLTNRGLLGLEQFAMGGIYTVRGYRQNAVVRDNGAVLSAEWRIPVWESRGGHSLILSPLVDAAHGWNAVGHPGPAETLASVGVGIGWRYRSFLRAQVYYAEALLDVPTFGDGRLQEEGFLFSLSVGWP